MTTTRERLLFAAVAVAAIVATATSLSTDSAESPLRFDRRRLAIREALRMAETQVDLDATLAERVVAPLPLVIPDTFEPIGRRVLATILLAIGSALFSAALVRATRTPIVVAAFAGATIAVHPLCTVFVATAAGLPTLLAFALAAGGTHAARRNPTLPRQILAGVVVLVGYLVDPILLLSLGLVLVVVWSASRTEGARRALVALVGATGLLAAVAVTWEAAEVTTTLRVVFACLPALALAAAGGATAARGRVATGVGVAALLVVALVFGTSWRDAESRWRTIADRRADDTASERAEALHALGLLLALDPSRSAEALTTLRAARDLAPPASMTQVRLAEIHLLRGEIPEAQQELVPAWPDVESGGGRDPLALRSLYFQVAGRGLVFRQLWENAEIALRKAGSPNVRRDLAITLDVRARLADQDGKRDLAMKRWAEAGELDDTVAGPHVARARDHLLENRLDEAEQELELVQTLDRLHEDDAAALAGLALIRIERDEDPPAALITFGLATKKLERDALAGGIGDVGLLAEWLGRPSIRALRDDDIDGRYALALTRLGRTREAERVADALVARRPDDPDARRLLAVLRLELREFDRAIELLEPLVAAHPSTFILRLNLAAAYRGAGREDDAIRTANEALKLARSDSETAQVRTFLAR